MAEINLNQVVDKNIIYKLEIDGKPDISKNDVEYSDIDFEPLTKYPGYQILKPCERMPQFRDDKTGNLLSQYRIESGFLICFLQKDNEWIPKPIHKLIAEQYLGYNEDNMDALEVAHKDKNKFNNFIDNICILPHTEYEINKRSRKYFKELPDGERVKLLKFKEHDIPEVYYRVDGEVYKKLKHKFLRLNKKRNCVSIRINKTELVFSPDSEDLVVAEEK
jgi:hypothetical protein